MARKLLIFQELVLLKVILVASCYSREQVLRVIPDDAEELKVLADAIINLPNLDVWKAPKDVGIPADLRMPEKDVQHVSQLLRDYGVKHYVMIEDIQYLVDEHRRKRSVTSQKVFNLEDFNYGIYHPAHEIEEWMNMFVNEFKFAKKFQIGVTYEGRAINALEISRSKNRTKPTIYVDSLTHGREWIAGAATMFAFYQIVTNSSSWMLDEINWVYVPILNVDGYIYTWNTDRLWRKNRSAQASLRCFGTDLNRNFDDHWQSPKGASIEPCSYIFRGPFSESESEIRHIANFIQGQSDVIKAVVTVHSYAQVVIYPYNYDLNQYPTNNNEQNETAREMSEEMFKLYKTEYRYGAGAETLGVSTGVTTDWTQSQANIDINLTVELRDTGEHGFLLPEDQILPTGEELLAGLKVLSQRVQKKYNSI